MISEEAWKIVAPKRSYIDYVTLLEPIMYSYKINTKKRVSMFLAQASHESGGFQYLSENLNYSAKGLAATWPSRYKNKATGEPNDLALSIERNPVAIANHTYANRMGNGTIDSGDGWRYRGRGIFQLTGKTNYKKFFTSISEDVKPKLLEETEYAIKSACWYWSENNLNRFADEKDIKGCTKAINGGYIGLDDRAEIYNKIYDLIRD